VKTNITVEDPEITPHNYIHLIFDKGAKKTYTGEKIGSSWYWQAGYLHVKS
jgi:hypothetical protein